MARINRKDWLLSEHHRICSDHLILGEIIHILFIVLIKKVQESLVHYMIKQIQIGPLVSNWVIPTQRHPVVVLVVIVTFICSCVKGEGVTNKKGRMKKWKSFDVETEEHATLS